MTGAINTDAPLNNFRLGLVGPIPPPYGGMAMQTQQLTRLLEAEGVAVDLFPTNAPYRPAFIAKIPLLRALARLIPFLLGLWRLAGRVDVIHLMANSGWSWQLHSAPTLWLSWLRSTPVIVNYRGGEAQVYFDRSFRWVKPSLKKATATVVPSAYLHTVFERFGETTQIIPNIIDRELFHPQANKTSDTFTLVITRNLEAIYGIDTAIRAFAQVFAKDPSLRLRIAGSGPEESALRTLTQKLAITDAVSFEGRLDRPGIVALYADADAMLNPSTVDNMPNSVLEALACGLPVISTDVGGVPFIVTHGETALLVPPSDVAAMAQAIEDLKSNPTLHSSLSENGLAQIEQYTWPRVRRQWLDLYAGLCRRPYKVTP